MSLPIIANLHGQVFITFWITIFLVLGVVLSLPHLDPRKIQELSPKHGSKIAKIKTLLEQQNSSVQQITNLNTQLNLSDYPNQDSLPHIALADSNGLILTYIPPSSLRYRILNNFIAEGGHRAPPKQKLYGEFLLIGPIPITLANKQLNFYAGMKTAKPPSILLQMFDKPAQLLLVVMAVSTPLLLWLSWAISLPARKLEHAAQRVIRGELITHPELECGSKEFRKTGESFNQMINSINRMMSNQQRLLSDISHELRSPLTRLSMANSLAIRKQGESAELTRIEVETKRLEKMIGELLHLSRSQFENHQDRELWTIDSLWQEVLLDAQFEANQRNKQLHLSPIPGGTILGNRSLLASALDNVIRNAIYYSQTLIEIDIINSEGTITVVVEDDGPGVENGELEAIFDPFYRVSSARELHTGGTGLGLAIAQNAALQHDGNIKAEHSMLGGLKVTIIFPDTQK